MMEEMTPMPGATTPDPTAVDGESGIPRQAPQPEQARAALVTEWASLITEARTHWEYAFKRMRRDQKFARGYQWEGQKRGAEDDERYVANITLRHVNQKVAALYAKNPKALAHRRPSLDFSVWDGDPNAIMKAQQTMQMAQQAMAQTGDPQVTQHPEVLQAQELMQDVTEGLKRKKLYAAMGRTLETVYEHQVQEQIPPFKKAMKRLVRRTVTTGVAYVKLGYHRDFERSAQDVDRVTDDTDALATLQRLKEDQQDQEFHDQDSDAERLRLLLQTEAESEILVREGLDFDYPHSTRIIPDKSCQCLDGFLGSQWAAEQYLLSPKDVQELFAVDVGSQFRAYSPQGPDGHEPRGTDSPDDETEIHDTDKVCVWEVYDKRTRMVHWLADGYPDFLREPSAPSVKLERFWPWFTLMFNEVEDEDDIFPPSDVALMRDMQVEHNVARQRLREHRDANRPKHVTPKGMMEEQDKAALTYSDAHTVVELNALQPGQKITDILQPVPHNNIDPNLYETNTFFDDIMKVGGAQEANLGGAAGITATESSIAEASRMTAIGSNIDDFDDFLTEIARAGSQILLMEMDAETVKEISGPGAVWPELSAQEVARELWLEVKAGSSGKPNKAQEIQNFERLAPFLLQTPGLNPKWFLEQLVQRLDDRADFEEAVAEGVMSIVSQNGQVQPGTGNPGTDPNAQGNAGGQNQPQVPGSDANQGPNNAGVGPPDSTGRPTAVARGSAPPIPRM